LKKDMPVGLKPESTVIVTRLWEECCKFLHG